MLLTQYKLYDLYSVLRSGCKEYDKFLTSIINSATEHLKLFGALIDLYVEVCKEQKIDIADSMGQTYDRLPKEYKKKVCGAMMGKKEFFSDAYGMMMDVFGNVLEKGKEDGIGE